MPTVVVSEYADWYINQHHFPAQYRGQEKDLVDLLVGRGLSRKELGIQARDAQRAFAVLGDALLRYETGTLAADQIAWMTEEEVGLLLRELHHEASFGAGAGSERFLLCVEEVEEEKDAGCDFVLAVTRRVSMRERARTMCVYAYDAAAEVHTLVVPWVSLERRAGLPLVSDWRQVALWKPLELLGTHPTP